MSNTLYPNTFQHHNAYIDRIAYFLTGNEEKVLNRILREIMGWEKGRAALATTVSISVLVDGKFSRETGERLASGCGLKEGAVRSALATLVEYNIIKRVGLPDTDGQTYALNLEWDSINWQGMEEKRAAKDAVFAAQMSVARQSNPLLLANTPPVEQEAPPPVGQEAPPPVKQETKKPISKQKSKPTAGAQSPPPTVPAPPAQKARSAPSSSVNADLQPQSLDERQLFGKLTAAAESNGRKPGTARFKTVQQATAFREAVVILNGQTQSVIDRYLQNGKYDLSGVINYVAGAARKTAQANSQPATGGWQLPGGRTV